jgi:pyruvate,water dikinase
MRGDVGAKARNLEKMVELGLEVPVFLVVGFAEVWRDWGAVRKELESCVGKYLGGKWGGDRYEKAVREILRGVRLNGEVIDGVAQRVAGWKRVSFRTSAADEDGERMSFAGQYKTFLDVGADRENVRKYVRKCFESVVGRGVVEYAKRQGRKHLVVGGAVVVQKMFYGEKCGVAFSEDGAGNVTLAWVEGWKNTVVEGGGAKSVKVRKTKVREENVADGLGAVVAGCMLLEQKMGGPLDIEWAVRGRRVAFLQMRPKTVHESGYEFEWDSTNISESYPGVTLPLTYSFIRELYGRVYPEFLEMIGTSRRDLRRRREVFENVLGYLNGRVYYRISNWYEIVKLIPGRRNQEFFEAMLNPVRKRGHAKKSKLDVRSVGVMVRFGWKLMRSGRMSRRFRADFARRFAVYDKSMMEYMNAEALMMDMRAVREELLGLWAIPILNDVRVMIWHGVLKIMVLGGMSQERYLGVLGGLVDRASIRPLEELGKLGERLAFEMGERGVGVDEVAECEWAVEMVREYVAEFGARTPDELKLENPRLMDSARDVIELALKARGNVVVAEASGGVDLAGVGGVRRWVARLAIRNVREAIDWRERFRFNRAQVFDLARRAYLRIGDIFVSDGVIEERADIFYLTDGEIENVVGGHAFEYGAREIVERRKRIFAEYEKMKLAKHVVGRGEVAARHLVETEIGRKELRGEGVAAGKVVGEVVVAEKFDARLDVRGKILVVGHIDPGWTLIFTQAAGVVTERGNALSHVAIVAREIGIPAVVGVDGAKEKLKSGMRVSIDGASGEVVIENDV